MKFLLASVFAPSAAAWLSQPIVSPRGPPSALHMAQVGIIYGTSTGSTQEVADKIYEAFGPNMAAEPLDVDSFDAGVFTQHESLIVGTPTWNTGADSQRSGTGWDELYDSLSQHAAVLKGKKVAVFGLGDQESYGENFADATGELFDVFEGLGCQMMGSWSQEGYEHEASKSIRGDKFCGLICDMVNQEELTDERVEQWVAQLLAEGFVGGGQAVVTPTTEAPQTATVNGASVPEASLTELENQSSLLDESISAHSTGGFTPHRNPAKDKTLWVSADGKSSFVTAGSGGASGSNAGPFAAP